MVRLDLPNHVLFAAKLRWKGRAYRSNALAQSRGEPVDTFVTQPTPANRPAPAPVGPKQTFASTPEASAAQTSTQPPLANSRRKRAKPRKRQKARPPCNNWPAFMAAHVDDPRSIARNEEHDFAHVRLTPEAEFEIAPQQAISLPACNYTARIAYARIATDLITRFTASLPGSTLVHWVTLIRDSYTVRYDDAAGLNLFKLQQWVRAELRGCSFIGMTEAALYTNAGEVRPKWKRAISWHPHLIVWGVSKQRMREIRDSINVRFRTLIPGVKAAHFRTLEPQDIEGQVLYALKAPVNEYRIIPKTKKTIDQETGEITKEPTGRFKSAKYQLGPSELVRMANLMAGRTLDKLAFAGGEGKAILETINFEARAAYRAVQARGRALEAVKRSVAAARIKQRRQ